MSTDDTWIKVGRSDGGSGCVELRRNGEVIEVRDSKDGEVGPILRFTPAEWAAWLDGAKGGEFDHLV